MKTAMQELIDEIKEAVPYFKLDIYQPNFNKALEKEKEQIENAHANNRCLQNKTMECTIEAYKNAEKYYNQTYN